MSRHPIITTRSEEIEALKIKAATIKTEASVLLLSTLQFRSDIDAKSVIKGSLLKFKQYKDTFREIKSIETGLYGQNLDLLVSKSVSSLEKAFCVLSGLIVAMIVCPERGLYRVGLILLNKSLDSVERFGAECFIIKSIAEVESMDFNSGASRETDDNKLQNLEPILPHIIQIIRAGVSIPYAEVARSYNSSHEQLSTNTASGGSASASSASHIPSTSAPVPSYAVSHDDIGRYLPDDGTKPMHDFYKKLLVRKHHLSKSQIITIGLKLMQIIQAEKLCTHDEPHVSLIRELIHAGRKALDNNNTAILMQDCYKGLLHSLKMTPDLSYDAGITGSDWACIFTVLGHQTPLEVEEIH